MWEAAEMSIAPAPPPISQVLIRAGFRARAGACEAAAGPRQGREGDEAAGLALDAALELEVGEGGGHRRGGQAEVADELVLGQRRGAEPVEDAAARGRRPGRRRPAAGAGGRRPGRAPGPRGRRAAPRRPQRLEHVGRAARTSVAPSRSSARQPAARGSIGWPGTAITSRPASAARRAVMSEPDRSAASTTTTAPARGPRRCGCGAGKWRACGSRPERMLGDAEAAGRDLGREARVLLRVDVVHAARHHRHGAGGERGAVRLGVDAAGEARDDDEARLAQALRPAPAPCAARARRRCGRRPAPPAGRGRRAGSPSAQRRGGASARAARSGGIGGLAPGEQARAERRAPACATRPAPRPRGRAA